MKLELKHIVGYLPYGLKCQNTFGNIVALKGINNQTENQFNWNFNDFGEDLIGYSYQCRPILRPLHDLINEIEFNGKSFVPVEWLENMYYTLDIHKQCERIIEDERWINNCDYLLIQHLFEWHFDIHKLIENGLAININTLEP